nr:PREDICTED: uncharacterized protein LOC105663831 [Megachile rotundata]
MDHPMKYIPGVIHRIKNPEDTSMKDVLERADTFKVVVAKVESLPEDSPPVDKRICSPRKSPRTKDQDLPKIHTAPCDNDRRWQASYKSTDVVSNDAERQRKLRRLTRPFSHELHVWYLKNKPTKLQVSVRHAGKRPIPERRFSHL